jgi:dTDP-glucose 4,6-dehydratase
MNKIIVTGGSGFIGSNLIQFLLKKKFFVINIDKNIYSSELYNSRDFRNKKYRFYNIDINNRKKLLQIFSRYKPVGVFNLAAETHVDRSIDTPHKFLHSNVNGVYNLLETIREYKRKNKKKIRLIHISTDEVYGDMLKKDRSDENYPYKPSSPYSATKAASDHLVKSYVRTFKLEAVISNCCNNYGPGQFPEKLIPTLIFNMTNNKPLPIYGKGKNSREWLHVKDDCEALYKIFKKGKIGESYNVGSGINLSNIQLTKTILKLVKEKQIKIGNNVKIKFVKDRPGHDIRYALNINKIKKNLQWKTSRNLSKGLSETIDWYIENKKFFKVFSKKLFFKRVGLTK